MKTNKSTSKIKNKRVVKINPIPKKKKFSFLLLTIGITIIVLIGSFLANNIYLAFLGPVILLLLLIPLIRKYGDSVWGDTKEEQKREKMAFELFQVALLIISIYIAGSSLILTEKATKDTHDALTITQEMLSISKSEADRNTNISFTYSQNPIGTDLNEVVGFWAENTGYRTVLLQPTCLMTIHCDNNYSDNIARSRVTQIATNRTLEDYNSTDLIILKIGDLVFFRTSNTPGEMVSIDSNKLSGKTNCFVSCPIKNYDNKIIADANLQIKQN